MTDDPKHPFDPDKALTDPKDDRLNRDDFSRELAEHIGSWKGNESIVIGINGDWGTGKSTVKHFIQHYLRERNPEPTIVEFNPWEWSGQKKLLEGFLSQIGIALGRADKAGNYKQLAKKWKRFANYLQLTATLGDAIRNTAKGAFGAGLGVTLFSLLGTGAYGFIPVVILGLMTFLAAAFAFVPAVVNGVVKFFGDQAEIHEKSIDEVKEELSDGLKKLESPVVVFIDDVDRLTDEEVKVLFQLVKANCRFPNMIYVILYERKVVELALSKIVSGGGRRYLRKIVQHSFDLPHPSLSRLRKIIGEEIDKALTLKDVAIHWNVDRWRDGLGTAFFSWFGSIRDAKRYIGSLRFVIARHSPKGALEVDPVDLVLIEALRAMHYEVYRAIATGFHAIESASIIFEEDEKKEAFRSQVASIVESLPEDVELRKSIKTVLEGLFPQAIDHSSYSESTEVSWLKDRRVCHPKFFHRYFQLALDEGDLSAFTLDHVVKSSGDLIKVRKILDTAKSEEKIFDLLEGIFAVRDRLPSENLGDFFTALFDSGDDLPEATDPFLMQDPSMAVIRIVHHRLRKEPAEFRDATLLEVYNSTSGIYLPVRYYNMMDRESKNEDRPLDELILSEGQLPEIRKQVLRMIRRRTSDMTMLDLEECAYILFRWREWGGEAEIREWTASVIEDPHRALNLLVRLLATSFSHPGGKKYFFTGKSVENLVDLDALNDAVVTLDTKDFDEVESQAVELLGLTIKRRDSGEPYTEVRLGDH